ncbi:MAG: NADH-quinone oxidoreductase subunit H [Acidimicrobiales bacterium]
MNAHAPAWAAPLIAAGVLAVGIYLVAVLDAAARRVVAGVALGAGVSTEPVRAAAGLAVQHRSATERPDAALWVLAPALLAGLAALAVVVVPWSPTFSIADVEAGIVLWGTIESLVIVAFFWHGWSANSHQPLIAGYRYVAVGLSELLLSMFVLIAAAIPAQSLRLSAIVASQNHLWNVVRQPLGLPLFAIVAMGSASWGPMDLAGGADLSGGTQAEVAGVARLTWLVARAAILVSFSLMGAVAFLGGWHGPLLPGPLWVAFKAVAVLVVLVVLGHVRVRVRAERFVTVCWLVLLPLAFVDLAIAGIEGLR